MELWPISDQDFKSFFFIFIRVGIIFIMFPFFNSRIIPTLSKVGLALLITIVLFPVVDVNRVEFPATPVGMAQLVLTELMIGMILGLLIQLFFEGVKFMGQWVGFQTGFAMVNIIDPQSGAQVSVLANLAYFVALVLFLLLNGHHIILTAMKESFEIVSPGSFHLNKQIFEKMVQVSGDLFVIALKIGAPAMAVLLFTMVAFGITVKFIPQMNIMIVAFPVKIVIGLFFFGICLNVLSVFVERYLGDLGSLLMNTMVFMGE